MTRQEELEAIELEFMEKWEAGEKPTLQDFCERHPEHCAELVDFVMEWLPIHNAVLRMEAEGYVETEADREMSERAIRRAMEIAGIPVPAGS